MDAKRRRPDHPDYDPRTLYLPPNFFKVKEAAGPAAPMCMVKQKRMEEENMRKSFFEVKDSSWTRSATAHDSAEKGGKEERREEGTNEYRGRNGTLL
eukprot:1160134-Pelagomonas_calceolata.AAC.5